MSIKVKMINLGLKIKKHAPAIAVTTGVIAMTTGTVFACKATLKLKERVVEPTKNDFNDIHTAVETLDDYTSKDRALDVMKASAKAAGRAVKTYAVPALIMTTGAALIFKGHNMMAARNAAITAAYSALQKHHESYRASVKDLIGEEQERRLEEGISHEVHTVTDEKGKTHEESFFVAPEEGTAFSFWYDPTHFSSYDRSNEYNLMFLEGAKAQADREFALTKKRITYARFLDLCHIKDEFMPKQAYMLGRVYPDANAKEPGYLDIDIRMAYKKSKIDGSINMEERYPYVTFHGLEDISDKIFLGELKKKDKEIMLNED